MLHACSSHVLRDSTSDISADRGVDVPLQALPGYLTYHSDYSHTNTAVSLVILISIVVLMLVAISPTTRVTNTVI